MVTIVQVGPLVNYRFYSSSFCTDLVLTNYSSFIKQQQLSTDNDMRTINSSPITPIVRGSCGLHTNTAQTD